MNQLQSWQSQFRIEDGTGVLSSHFNLDARTLTMVEYPFLNLRPLLGALIRLLPLRSPRASFCYQQSTQQALSLL